MHFWVQPGGMRKAPGRDLGRGDLRLCLFIFCILLMSMLSFSNFSNSICKV